MVTGLKTSVTVENEIRDLRAELSYYLNLQNISNNSNISAKIQEILQKLASAQQEYSEEKEEDRYIEEKYDLAEARNAQIELNFSKSISELLKNYQSRLKTEIFDKEFNEKVFNPANGDVNQQAETYIEERACKAEECLADFRADKTHEFVSFLTEIEKQVGKEKALELIQNAFQGALECQMADFSTFKEHINNGNLSQEEIYQKFAEVTLQFDANVLSDLKQELEYQAAKTSKEQALASLSDDKTICFVSECGVSYCVDGSQISLNAAQAKNFIEFCADRAIDDNFSQNSQDECRQERLDFLENLVSDPDAFLEAIKPQIATMKNVKGKSESEALNLYLEAIDPKIKEKARKTLPSADGKTNVIIPNGVEECVEFELSPPQYNNVEYNIPTRRATIPDPSLSGRG